MAALMRQVHNAEEMAEEMKGRAAEKLSEFLTGENAVEALQRTPPGGRIRDRKIAEALFSEFDCPVGENRWAVGEYMDNWLHTDLKGDTEFAFKVLFSNGYMADWFEEDIQHKLKLIAAESCPETEMYSQIMRKDPACMMQAVLDNGIDQLINADDELLMNPDFILALRKHGFDVDEYASPALLRDPEFRRRADAMEAMNEVNEAKSAGGSDGGKKRKKR